jgi:hypothetical protein
MANVTECCVVTKYCQIVFYTRSSKSDVTNLFCFVCIHDQCVSDGTYQTLTQSLLTFGHFSSMSPRLVFRALKNLSPADDSLFDVDVC